MHDPYAFVSRQCKDWVELYGNTEPFDAARRDHPGQWVVVHDLRPLEFVGFLLGLNRPYRPVQVIRWSEEAQVFMSRPYGMLKPRVRRRLPMGPLAWWRSYVRRSTPTIIGLWRHVEWAIASASDRLDAVVRNQGRRRRVQENAPV